MSKLIKDEQWVWVVVQDPGGNEKFLGQHDKEKDVSFIPVFLDKDEALLGLPLIPREGGVRYEAQAIQIEELAVSTAESGFFLFVLNAKGEVLEKIDPREGASAKPDSR